MKKPEKQSGKNKVEKLMTDVGHVLFHESVLIASNNVTNDFRTVYYYYSWRQIVLLCHTLPSQDRKEQYRLNKTVPEA